MSDAERVKQEEIDGRRSVQEAVRAQTVKIRQHVRTRVTKVSTKVAEFQTAFPGEAAEEPVAYSKLVAFHGTLEPLAIQLAKLDREVLDTYKPEFETDDEEEEDKAADYESLIREMKAYFDVLLESKKLKVEVQLNTSRAAIPTTPGLSFRSISDKHTRPFGGSRG